MPPDLPNEQALNLKKRARRRLVGAIALVLLMIIILPRILEDRAALAPQEAIKITMSVAHDDQEDVVLGDKADELKLESNSELAPKSDSETNSETIIEPQLPAAAEVISLDAPVVENMPAVTKSVTADDLVVNKPESKVILAKPNNSFEHVQDNPVVKAEAAKVLEVKPNEMSDAKVTSVPKVVEEKLNKKDSTHFTVQVGVYSDPGNVKYLQNKIKELGLSSHTEKIQTAKGEKIRLKAGSFTSRAEAIKAQAKLQKIGLAGMVVSNE